MQAHIKRLLAFASRYQKEPLGNYSSSTHKHTCLLHVLELSELFAVYKNMSTMFLILWHILKRGR